MGQFLRIPDTLNSLGKANIIGLELVQADPDKHGGAVEGPPEELADGGEAFYGNIVDNDGLEADVGVDEDGAAENSIQNGVDTARGERRNGQGHETGGEEPLKRPVVRAMAG